MNKILSIVFLFFVTTLSFANGEPDKGSEQTETQLKFVEAHSLTYEVVINFDKTESEEVTLKIYLSEYFSNKPVQGESVLLDIVGVDIRQQPVLIENGIYESKVIFGDTEKFDILINITENGINDLLVINDVKLSELTHVDDHADSLLQRIFTSPVFIGISILILIAITGVVFYRIGLNKKFKNLE